MTAFDTAWALLKAPFLLETGIHFDRENPTEIEGPLYSGGDSGDEPRYWTQDSQTALAYALFGSAIPADRGDKVRQLFREQVPMRETIPTIRIADDPGYRWRNKEGLVKDPEEFDANDDIQNYLMYEDPQSEAYIHDEHWGAPEYREMSREEMEKELLLALGQNGDNIHFGTLGGQGTTGDFKTHEERYGHLQGALERLRTNTRGRTYLDDKHKPLSQTSETDGIEDSEDYEYLQEWGRLDPEPDRPWFSLTRDD